MPSGNPARVTRLGEFSLISSLGRFLKMKSSSPHFRATSFHFYALILTKNGLGYILGGFSLTHRVNLLVASANEDPASNPARV
jgi:hypothetical protein